MADFAIARNGKSAGLGVPCLPGRLLGFCHHGKIGQTQGDATSGYCGPRVSTWVHDKKVKRIDVRALDATLLVAVTSISVRDGVLFERGKEVP